MRSVPEQSTLRELFDYDPATGLFVWRKARVHLRGQIAGQLRPDGYVEITIKNRRYGAHRLAWVWMYGKDLLGLEIDHKDLNRQNNAITNLRIATRREQSRNSPRRKNNKSGLKGVCRCHRSRKNPWRATINIDGKYVHLGVFTTPEEAHAAYVEAARIHHGEFARAG